MYNHGSDVISWLIELTENALTKDPNLDEIRGIMSISFEESTYSEYFKKILRIRFNTLIFMI